jgi:hypothetical protein
MKLQEPIIFRKLMSSLMDKGMAIYTIEMYVTLSTISRGNLMTVAEYTSMVAIRGTRSCGWYLGGYYLTSSTST